MSDILWLDDERQPYAPWFKGTIHWCRTVEEAIQVLRTMPIDIVSLDHDLGQEKTGYDLVKWMEEQDVWPYCVRIHTMNPVGRENIARALTANGYCQKYINNSWYRD